MRSALAMLGALSCAPHPTTVGAHDRAWSAPTDSVAWAKDEPLPADSARGAIVYDDYCAHCHGPQGRGDGPVAAHMPVVDVSAACGRSDAEIDDAIALGGPIMPSLSHAVDAQGRADVTAHIRSLMDCPTEPIGDGWCGMLTLFERHCLTCHNPAAKLGTLDLQTDPASALIQIPSGQWPDEMRVIPSDPDGSLLYRKIAASQAELGAPMPLGGALGEDVVSLVESWIVAGADTTCEDVQ